MKSSHSKFFVTGILVMLMSAPATVLGNEKDDSKSWPKTCPEAIANIISEMSEADKKTVRATPREKLIKYHRGWGMGIRNGTGLWRGNTSLMESCLALRKNAERHPDEVSMIIIEEIWAALQEKTK